MNILPSPATELSEARRCVLLEAAVTVFRRFGFRKASMDDVARAAGVSRQGLYLAFSNKEELFRRALEHSFSRQLKAALDVLSRADKSLEERLMVACDEWSGQFAGVFNGDAADLMCAGTSLAGEIMRHHEARFETALSDAIAASPMSTICSRVGVEPAEMARALHATAKGLKHVCKSREEFRKAIGAAVRVYCAPLTLQLKKSPT